MSLKNIVLNGENLTLENFYEFAHGNSSNFFFSLDPIALKKMHASRQVVLNTIKNKQTVYGINTGFGSLATTNIAEKDLATLQLNLIRSHCAGVGEPFPLHMTRAIILARANCLIRGHSGINPELVQTMLHFLNHDICPTIPCKGSLGASGDLAPLSHLALNLIGEGEVFFQNKKMQAIEAFNIIGKKPVVLGPKDGLALNNGTAVMLSLGIIAFIEAQNLMRTADVISALTVDTLRGSIKAFDPKISDLKPHTGQVISAKNIFNLLQNSEILNSHVSCHRVQDAYSLRCIPQVHGACRQTLRHAEEVLSVELQSVTDNPLIFTEENEIISGGNFHGEALALCLDYLTMGLSELANISERRINKLMDPHFSELSAFLTKDAGLSSGFMIAHYTCASLVSENKVLCHPASVDSIPTSLEKEDHVSMGLGAALKLQKVLENAQIILGTELMCAVQALDLLRPLKTSPTLEKVYSLVRQNIPPLEEDRVLSGDMEKMQKIIKGDNFLSLILTENIS